MENKWSNEAFKGEVPSGFQGKVGWTSPSNIALVKYWGKKGKQIPQNPSISFTLSECRSETLVTFEKADRFSFRFFFEGQENPAFGAKIEKFLLDYQVFFPFINQLNLKVESRNTFPHSSGIASSASSMSAFVMCLMEMESLLVGPSALRQAQGPQLVKVVEPVETPKDWSKYFQFPSAPSQRHSSKKPKTRCPKNAGKCCGFQPSNEAG